MKEHLRRLLPKNRFARSVSVLAGGTAMAQIIVVAASPVVTRLYSPDDFGALAVFAGLLGVLGVVVSLRYPLAIPLPKSDRQAASIVLLSLLVVMAMVAIGALIVFLWSDSIARLLNTPVLVRYLWLLPIGLLFAGIYQVFSYWAIRTSAFPAIARTKVVQACSMVGIQVGAYALGPLALILGQVAAQGAGSISLGMLAVRQRWNTFHQIRKRHVRWAVVRYRRFPQYSSWAGLFNAGSTQLPLILFAALFSPAAAGLYLLAHRVLAMPMQLIGQSVADVFLSKAATVRREGQLAPLVSEIHARLAHIAMPPVLILIFAAPDLFAGIFGEAWRQAGVFVQWMAPWLYFQFVASPLSMVFSVLEKQVHGMVFQSTLLLIRIGSLFIGAALTNLMHTVALFAICSALCYLGLLFMIVRVSGNSWPSFFGPTLSAFLVSMVIVIPLTIFTFLVESPSYSSFLTAIFATAVLMTVRYALLLKKSI